MQTKSFLSQMPFIQGFPLPKRKHKEFWVSTRTEVPVFAAESPSQMLDKGGEDGKNQLKANTLVFEEIPHLTLGAFGEGGKGGEDHNFISKKFHKSLFH